MNPYIDTLVSATAEAPGAPVEIADDDEQILVTARERFMRCQEAESEFRKLVLLAHLSAPDARVGIARGLSPDRRQSDK